MTDDGNDSLNQDDDDTFPETTRRMKEDQEEEDRLGGSMDKIVFPAVDDHNNATPSSHFLFASRRNVQDPDELMGPILRRKKVVSLPIGARSDFFVPTRTAVAAVSNSPVTTTTSPSEEKQQRRQKQNSFMENMIRRKQVSLDLLAAHDFFAPTTEVVVVPLDNTVQEQEPQQPRKLFRPLRFTPRGKKKSSSSHGTTTALPPHDQVIAQAFQRYSTTLSQELQNQIQTLDEQIMEKQNDNNNNTTMEQKDNLLQVSQHMKRVLQSAQPDEQLLTQRLLVPTKNDNTETTILLKATRNDKIKACIVAILMLAMTMAFCFWDTHPDDESHIFHTIGLACVTTCVGHVESRDFFKGHNHFQTGDVIELILHLDPYPEVVELENSNNNNIYAVVDIMGETSGQTKSTTRFGPVQADERLTLQEKIKVDFDHPEEHHYIVVTSSSSSSTDDENIHLSFTLDAHRLKPIADKSVAIAAVIMVTVYLFILLEIVHRTLVAIIGSMIALMFLFVMRDGETESIAQIMLSLEWSTLGLLFGMMLLVGELSHTGVFEWCAVRLLVASKGSFTRLMILLCTLTAIASAFLDNVTTMLLIAPVTIDMCNILEVDPRPYLIGEVLLSNIGGTATLIGDPPNIIIGSSFEEIGFVDFIIHVFPAIFLFAVPASLALTVYIYRYYLVNSKMRVLDTKELKETYPIYDEPRLLIAGTVTAFVILLFFLHPVHHKDTAWIALLGAFVTIAFTNPHDVQDVLRNHVEWDVLLFFAGLFVLVEACAAMGLLEAIGNLLADFIESKEEDKQLAVAITVILWVSAFTSAFLDNIPYTATMVPIVKILANSLDSLPVETLAWALSFGACLGGNGTLLGASANIVTAGISANKGYEITFLNFLYPGMCLMIVTVGISNLYMMIRYAWFSF